MFSEVHRQKQNTKKPIEFIHFMVKDLAWSDKQQRLDQFLYLLLYMQRNVKILTE